MVVNGRPFSNVFTSWTPPSTLAVREDTMVGAYRLEKRRSLGAVGPFPTEKFHACKQPGLGREKIFDQVVEILKK